MTSSSAIRGRSLLLGHPRSGTTLLRRLLGAHPEISSPPETHLFGACARFLASEETADGVDMGVLAGLHFAGFDDDDVVGRLRDLAFGLMDEIAERDGASHWIEKTAFDVFHLDGIEQLCGDEVKYLAILRHPLDVAVSCIDFCDAAGMYPAVLHPYVRRWPHPIEAFVHSWIDAANALIDLGSRRTDQVLICRYEDLVEDAADTVEAVLEFLELDADTGFLDGALEGFDQLGFSDHKSYQVAAVHQASVQRWNSIPSAMLARVAPALEPLLEVCGYDPLDVPEAASTAEGRARYQRSLAVHAARRTD